MTEFTSVTSLLQIFKMKTFQLVNTKILLILLSVSFLITAESSVLAAEDGFLNPDIDQTVSNLVVQPDGKILISGNFNNVGGQPRSKVARLNANGILDTSFQNPNITGEFNNYGVYALALQTDGKVLIGGLFNSVAGQTRNRLARLNSDGSLDTAFAPEVNNVITAIVLQPDGKIIIGGYFTLVGGQPRNRVARLNLDGTLDMSFQDPNVNVANGSTAYPIGTLAIQPDGRILIGGYFNSVGGQSRSGVARLNPDGTLDTNFKLNIDGIVSQFVFQPDGKILIGGFFRVVNGTARTTIARINFDGSLDDSFQNVNISSGAVTAFDIQSDGKVIIGGSFSNINEQERRNLARLNSNGTFDASFKDPNANFGGNFYSINRILIQPDGKVLVGGQFDTVGRQPRKMVVRLLSDGSLDLPPAQTLTVTKTADTNDGVCNSDCSLREAVAAANANVEASQINFDASLFSVPQTITLASGELVIADNHRLAINGTGANLLTISGNNQSRVFRINRDAVVLLSGLTVSGGNGAGGFDSGNGGGIYVSPNGSNTTLTLNNVTVRNNRGLAGAGICVFGLATVNINNSTFAENTATYNYGGGGIYLYLGSLNITNSIIKNNTATFKPSGGGGGIAIGTSSAAFTITNSVITENSADSAGGISAGGTGVISGSTISNNRANGAAGGLHSSGILSLIDSTVSGNTVVDSNGTGGGIFNFGRLSVSNSTVSGNSAAIGGGILTYGGLNASGLNISNNTSSKSGAGIYSSAGGTTTLPVTLNNSIISGNNSSEFGGGIYNREQINLVNTTVRNNSSSLGGGGIFNVFLNVGTATLNATNSTINGNTSNAAGGGIANQTGTVNLTNSTVSNNTARGVGGGITNNSNGKINLINVTIVFNTTIIGAGGGVNNSGDLVTALNTIFARNVTGGNAPAASDFNGTINSQGYNIIGTTKGTTIAGTTTGNLLNTDPVLSPLADNGGLTLTHALGPNSPAIDAGNPANVLAADQRGFTRPNDGNGDGLARGDIGAFEVRPVFVTNINDSGAGSLRQSLLDVISQGDTVVFNANVFNSPQTITLTSGELVIPQNANFTINGKAADQLIINGNNQSRVLFVSSGANVTIGGVTITGGNGAGAVNSGFGGGIYNNGGTLNLLYSVIQNNKTTAGNGGGIRNDNGGKLTVLGTSIRNNISVGDGGAIFSFGDSSQVDIVNSTINNNSASSGGGIFNFNTLSLTNSTISSNTSVLFGGGIFNNGGIATITSSTISNNKAGEYGGGAGNSNGAFNARNTIISGNNTTSGTAPDFWGALTSQGYNLIENTNGSTIGGTITGNILGQSARLLPLGNYGGATLTHALSINSPAIDKGNSFGVSSEQRNFARPVDFPCFPNASGGNGADIGAFEIQIGDLSCRTLFDFDGDSKADISVYRPSSGTWYVQNSQAGFSALQFGQASDKIVPADYDGDGKTDIAIWRDGIWYLQRSTQGFASMQFGSPSDVPVPSDYNGDGKADLAVYRPSNGTWYVLNAATNQYTSQQWGASTDKPVVADYDGDGKADYAVHRPENGIWYILRSRDGFFSVQWGESTDKPVGGDYDGDGKADQAVYRPSNGTWYILRSQDGFTSAQFGESTDLPVPSDYDGDGKTDIAVYRPANGTWYQMKSTQGFTAIQFGDSTDRPIPNAFVP